MTSNPFSMNGNPDANVDQRDPREDQQINAVIAQAMEIVEKGGNAEALLSSLPPHLQERAKKWLRAAVEEKRAAKSSKEVDSKPKGLRALTTLMAKQAFDKIIAAVRSRPDVQTRVQEAGRVLMRNGVIVDMVRVAESDLGTLPPMVGVAKQKEQTVQR